MKSCNKANLKKNFSDFFKDRANLTVDPCYKTGAVRGILCYKCNRDMNVSDDDIQFQKLLDYKNKYKGIKNES